MSGAASYIPVVDISPLYSDNPAEYAPVDQAIGQALQVAGAFLADGIPKPVKPDSKQTKNLMAFYNLPLEKRLEVGLLSVNPSSTKRYRGYANNKEGGLIRTEIFDIGPKYVVTGPDFPDVEQLIETNSWPAGEPEPGWQAEMENYYDHMHDFSKRLIRSIIRFIGADEAKGASRFDHSNSTLRLLNYPSLPEGVTVDPDPERMREFGGEKLRLMITEHKDQCCLTLLWQSSAGGLQMQSPAGDWYAVPYIKNGISVHLGMAMEQMTGNVFQATPHRVLGKSSTARQSIGFFFEPNLHASAKPFQDEDNTPLGEGSNTYAALLLKTFAEREARRKAKGES